MKTIVALLLLSCCGFGPDKAAVPATEAGCGPQDARFELKSEESQHPAPTPEDGSALVRARMVGISTGFVLQLDQLGPDEGRWFVAWSKFRNSRPKD